MAGINEELRRRIAELEREKEELKRENEDLRRHQTGISRSSSNAVKNDWKSKMVSAGAFILTDIVLPAGVGKALDRLNVDAGITRRCIEVGADFLGKTSVEMAVYTMGYSVYEGPAEILLAKTCDVVLRQLAKEAIDRGFNKISVKDSRCKKCARGCANFVVSRVIDIGTSKAIEFIRTCDKKSD